MVRTVDAIYEEGVLTLEQPVDLDGRIRVRVRIELPDDTPAAEDPSGREATLSVEAPGALHAPAGTAPDTRMLRLSPENRSLYRRIKELQERMGPVDFDITETLREFRENG